MNNLTEEEINAYLAKMREYLKSMESVYKPFYEPGCETTDKKTGKRIIMQEDGTWKEVE